MVLAMGMSGHASNNQPYGMRRFASMPLGGGHQTQRFPPQRGFMSRPDGGYGNRGNLGSRPRYPNQQNRGHLQAGNARYRSTASSESRMASQPIASPRHNEDYYRDSYSRPRSPPRNDIVSESSSESESVYRNDRRSPKNTESSVQERGQSAHLVILYINNL
jgi:hypothetical protein